MPTTHENSYFHFTKKERTGILLLTSLALISVGFSILHPYIFKSKAIPAHSYAGDILQLEAQAVDTASIRTRYKKEYQSYKPYSKAENYRSAGELFYFDPNTISENEWRKLGVREKTIQIIKNYLAKGGHFREAADIKKIWSLHGELADKIIPFVRISNTERHLKKQYNEAEGYKKYPEKEFHIVNINEGDTSDLTRLPGIGPKLSQRIIKYRDRLGGFYTVDQVAETFGLPDSTYRKVRAWLKVEKDNIKTININSASVDELRAHPYIRYHLANAMVQYRQQHKEYASVNEIRNIMLVDDTTFRKVAPYLVVE